MSIEQSPYEGALDTLNGKTCLGRVYNIDEDSRLCQVRTIGASAYGTDDLDLQFVKCQHFAWHAEGDFATVLPRIGTYVIISFVNSEPIITGVYPLSNTEGAGGRDNQQNLQAGDFGWQAVAGNSFIIRAAGTIEITCTNGCRTWWLPTNDTITTLCQNFELDPAGGYLHWTVDPKTADTVFDLKFFDNAAVANVGRLQLGTGSTGSFVSLEVGPPDENLNISEDTFSLQIQPDGTTALNIGNGNAILNITPDGKASLTTASDVNVTAGGDANVTASGNATVKATEIVLNSKGSGITTFNGHMGVVDTITGLPVKPSTSVFADV